ncbi:MAG: hypothetical protein IID43_00245, partial [Planctomycetes bacterium]|nr:hypothetical protein [Planctomycetota bacterium]
MNQVGESRRRFLPVALIFLTAVAVGLPTLRGGFVGGDDRRLVLNHVLVNHPSLAHAAELFTIIHRDLYQPLPLLSFSAEFAVAGSLGLLDEGIAGGAWLFHLTNVLLHAVNAVLVWILITTWSARPDDRSITPAWVRQTCESSSAVATMAALLFAIHPLQVEVIAWLNGRMMLMSTLFALSAVVSLGVWMRGGRLRWAIAVVVCVALCGLSKVRIGLPFLLVLVPLVRGVKPNRRLVLIWLSAAVVMG